MLTSAHKFLFVVIAKIEYLHSSQVFKTLGCFFIPKRRSDYEFPTQNPLAKIKISRKEDSNAKAELRKSRVAVGQGDQSYDECAKEEFREKWNKKYPNILKSWDKNWAELTVFFEYPQEIRKIIYTTNAVEGYHRMVRKFTKSKSIFPTDDAIRKVVYMSVSEISKKWTMPVRNWGLAYAQFMIYFEDRFAA